MSNPEPGAQSAGEPQPQSLLRQLYFNKTGILLLSMIIAAIAMYSIATHASGESAEFWIALATGLLASSIFTFFQVTLTTQQFDRFLNETIKTAVVSEISATTRELTSSYRDIQSKYVPAQEYPGVGTPDKRFNVDVNHSMRHSSRYVFRGMTGKYAIARLGALSAVPSDVRIIIGDPTKPGAVNSRARRELSYRRGVDFEESRRALLDGINLSLVGAYALRMRFDRLEICLTADPNLDRLEIFDDDMYLTLFSDTGDEVSPFPPTLKFLRGSLIYDMNSRESSRLLASSYASRFEIARDSSEGEYRALLQRWGVTISAEGFAEYLRRFALFREEVVGDIHPAR